MFGYGNYNPYQPQMYSQPVPDQLAQLRAPYQAQQQPQPMPQAQAQSGGILWCQGEEGAKAYPVAPGNTVLLMDSDAERFFLKTVDSSGMPRPLRVFDYKERTEGHRAAHTAISEPVGGYVTREEFETLRNAVAALMPKKEDE